VRKDLTPIRGSDRPLAARWFLAHHTGRNPETISRRCTPVACDVRNRSLLYDVAEALGILGALRTRR
jgi:hypothetical protein